jgi:hypothetical protein
LRKSYLKENHKTGVGFTSEKNIEFYKKCGFSTDQESLQRFVHMKDNQKITNKTEDWVFYSNSEDKFMEKVLASPDKDILFPRDPDW